MSDDNTIPCPYCGAGAGEPCVSRETGRRTDYTHRRRVRALPRVDADAIVEASGDGLDAVIREFAAAAGRPVIETKPAALLVGCCEQTLRRAVHRGDLRASRIGRRGPLRFRIRDLARWYCDQQAATMADVCPHGEIGGGCGVCR